MAKTQGQTARLHYDESGRGATLLLVHGFPLDRRVWQAAAVTLAERVRVVAVDMRGFGLSSASTGGEAGTPFGLDDLADDLHALIAQLRCGPVVAAGLSMGGYVLQALARRYPGDLRGLALVDTKSEADGDEAKASRQRMIELVNREGSAAIASAMMPRMLAAGAQERRPALAAELRKIMEACPATTIAHALAAMRDRPDCTPDLPAIAVPVALIFGESDAITPVDGARQMLTKLRDGRLHVIADAGHMAPFEQPEACAAALLELMRRAG